MSADFHYQTLAELLALDHAGLEDCWDRVPTDDQTYLKGVLSQELRKQGAADDLGELRLVQQFISQYQEAGYVPAGDVWLRVPPHLHEQFRADDLPEDVAQTGRGRRREDSEGLPQWLALVLLALAFLAIPAAFYFFFLRGGGDMVVAVAVNQPTASATINATATTQPTIIPTPTVIALDNVDRSIGQGDRQDRDYFPVLLQLFGADAAQPLRTFVVQEHQISIAEWRFDHNPDIASWVGGLLVRPVLGIPYSQDNADLLQALAAGTSFVVTMNTGDLLRYTFTGTRTVSRTDSTIFRQTHPGLVLVLIGEKDSAGRPTADRLLVEADYDLAQEMDRIIRAGTPLVGVGEVAYPADGVVAQVVGARLRPDDRLAAGMVYALVDIQISTGDVALAPADLPFGLQDDRHTHYPPIPDASGDCPPWQQAIPARTVQCLGLAFVVAQSTSRATLQAGETGYALDFAPLVAPATVAGLELLLRRVRYDDRMLMVDLYIANPLASPVAIRRDDFWVALGYAANPSAPRLPPLFTAGNLLRTLPANATWEVTFQFPYSGESHASLGLLGRLYALQITGSA